MISISPDINFLPSHYLFYCDIFVLLFILFFYVIEMDFFRDGFFLEIHFELISRRRMSTFYLNVDRNSSKRSCRRKLSCLASAVR